MKGSRRAQRDARLLYRLCLVNGLLDEARVRLVVARVAANPRPASLAMLSRFQRLVRLDHKRHSAAVESAAPLPPDMRANIEQGLGRVYGEGIVTAFAENPALVGGVRITVGSDVYDGSVKGRLAAIAARF